MTQIKQKLYCFVDESGQDTEGKLFCVVAVLVKSDVVIYLNKSLIAIETEVGKKSPKWGKTSVSIRKQYILNTLPAIKRAGKIFFAVFHNSKEFTTLTAFTITQAISLYSRKENSIWKIIIDGLNETEKDKTLRIVKNYNIHYQKITGKSDQSEPILRLADSIAGLVRDNEENQNYATQLLRHVFSSGCITQIQK